jgi:hypothetical protein
MVENQKELWKEAAHAKFELFLERVQDELPTNASIADIERALLEYENSLLSDTFSLLALHPEIFPPEDEGGS